MAAAIIPIIASLAGGALGGLFGGGGKSAEIKPQTIPPIFPYGQKSFGDWLFQGLGFDPSTNQWNFQPLPSYPGQQVASPDTTRLADVWGQWDPQGDPGVKALRDYFMNNQGGVGQNSPIGQQLMDWGGMPGPGSDAYQSLMNYGVASPGAGHYMQSLAESGVTAPESGFGLQQFSRGVPTGSAQYLTPFLTGQASAPPQHPNYAAPSITPRQLQRVGG